MERFTKMQAWLVATVSILALCSVLALWDTCQSIADNRPVTPFTTWVVGFLLIEHVAMITGAVILHRHAPELSELRRASMDNVGLRTRVMFLSQENARMLNTIHAMEGRAAPVTAARQHARRQGNPQQNQQLQRGGT
ncbi:MAG: hypothetical protein EBU46_21595 [Nitrosomonadaceae bacterium]|nr:hypothetical protein [Nitrosomonadaceae bacterium]